MRDGEQLVQGDKGFNVCRIQGIDKPGDIGKVGNGVHGGNLLCHGELLVGLAAKIFAGGVVVNDDFVGFFLDLD